MQTQESTDTIIKIQNISKRYRNTNALSNFNLEIPRGTIYGLIGPNGAGKTTLLRILAALIFPNTGEVWFEDDEVSKAPAAIHRKIGYMPDFFGVYPDLTSAEYLEFYAGIYNIPRKKRERIVSDLLELVELSPKRDAFVETLSRGMKQRLCLARSLVHDPEVLLLDEPASGLDPRARIELRELVRTLQGMGKTIIISSHILPELAEMCTNVAIMQEGKLVAAGDVDTIAHRMGSGRQIEIRVSETECIVDALNLLKSISEISKVNHDEGNLIQAEFSGDDRALHRILVELINHNIPVTSFAPRSGSSRLEDVFMGITEGSNAS